MYVLCVDNSGYPASLEEGKLYEWVEGGGHEDALIRVVDESGEDYLYESWRFVFMKHSVS